VNDPGIVDGASFSFALVEVKPRPRDTQGRAASYSLPSQDEHNVAELGWHKERHFGFTLEVPTEHLSDALDRTDTGCSQSVPSAKIEARTAFSAESTGPECRTAVIVPPVSHA
jgi:hypothetical protein